MQGMKRTLYLDDVTDRILAEAFGDEYRRNFSQLARRGFYRLLEDLPLAERNRVFTTVADRMADETRGRVVDPLADNHSHSRRVKK